MFAQRRGGAERIFALWNLPEIPLCLRASARNINKADQAPGGLPRGVIAHPLTIASSPDTTRATFV